MSKKYAILCFILLWILILGGCSKGPEDVLDGYVKSWTELDYENMYDLISSQDRDMISFEKFKENYEHFYGELTLESIEVEVNVDEKEIDEKLKYKDSITVPISVKVITGYGEKIYDTDVDIVKEKDGDESVWKVDWDYDLIFDNLSQGDSIETVNLFPERGKIFDRNGRALAENSTVIQVGIVPGRLGEMKEEIISDMANTFDITEEYINQRLNLSWVSDETFVDLLKIPKEDISLIEKLHNKNTGATYREVEDRVYPYGEVSAHLVGYLGYAGEDEIEELEELGFSSDDKIGRTGLEKIYDEKLRGTPGKKVVVVDDSGKQKQVIFEQQVKDGEDVRLSVDIELQKKLYSQMKDEKGAASVINYTTGEVLALVSTPSYDPNQFILGISDEKLAKLQESESRPLLNRFTGVYPPGSTFKPLVAAIALDENVISESFSVDVKGNEWQLDDSWGNYYIARVTDPGTPVDLKKAMIYSDNIYFGQVALKMGRELLTERTRDFGIGADLDFQYGMTRSQIANEDQITSDIMLADSGYGQGQVLVNILNMPKAYSAFVNDGKVVEPTLIYGDGEHKMTEAVSKGVSEKVFDLLVSVVEHSDGTANGAYIEGKTIGGKTGTAEIESTENSSEKEELGWFVVIDKSDDTPYITAMMIEDTQGRGGSHLVVPKVSSFIRAYSR